MEKPEVIRIDLQGVNSYLLRSQEGFVLVDAGGPLILDHGFCNRREYLVQALQKEGCIPGKLKLLLLTHGDVDHVFNAAYIKDTYKVPIAMDKADINLVDHPDLDLAMSSFHYQKLSMKLVSKLFYSKIAKKSAKILEQFESFVPDFFFQDGQSLKRYGVDARIVTVPGHTLGSIAILTSGRELICGDLFANMKKPEIALNAVNFNKMKDSAEKIKSKHVIMVYPGHGNPFRLGEL